MFDFNFIWFTVRLKWVKITFRWRRQRRRWLVFFFLSSFISFWLREKNSTAVFAQKEKRDQAKQKMNATEKCGSKKKERWHYFDYKETQWTRWKNAFMKWEKCQSNKSTFSRNSTYWNTSKNILLVHRVCECVCVCVTRLVLFGDCRDFFSFRFVRLMPNVDKFIAVSVHILHSSLQLPKIWLHFIHKKKAIMNCSQIIIQRLRYYLMLIATLQKWERKREGEDEASWVRSSKREKNRNEIAPNAAHAIVNVYVNSFITSRMACSHSGKNPQRYFLLLLRLLAVLLLLLVCFLHSLLQLKNNPQLNKEESKWATMIMTGRLQRKRQRSVRGALHRMHCKRAKRERTDKRS